MTLTIELTAEQEVRLRAVARRAIFDSTMLVRI